MHSRRLQIGLVVLAAGSLIAIALVPIVRWVTEYRIASHFASQRTWLADEKPFLANALTLQSAKVKTQVTAAGIHGPLAPELTYLIPAPDNAYLLVAEFRLRLNGQYEPTGVESASFRCISFKNAEIVEREGRQWRRYQGVLLDEGSFEKAVSDVLAKRSSPELASRLATDSSMIAEWGVEYDMYHEFMPTTPSSAIHKQ